jgi:pyrroloquinoline quinone biosynthesis protein D
MGSRSGQPCHPLSGRHGQTQSRAAAAILELVDGQRDAAAIIAILNERFPEAGGVDDDVVEFLQIAYQQKWIIFREPE